jgi:hypothetical protein
MLISIDELSSAMQIGDIDPKAIESIKELAKKRGATHIEASEDEILALAEKVNKIKDKDEIKKQISEKCKTFTKNTKEILTLVVLVMFLSAALGLAFTFGSSLFKPGTTDSNTGSEPIAQA